MSLESWKVEFYPVPAAGNLSDEEALRQALRKWEGLTEENLAKHQVYLNGRFLVDGVAAVTLMIDNSNCTLCHKYIHSLGGEGGCAVCPLKDCSEQYSKFSLLHNPQPMIDLLSKTLAEKYPTCLLQVGKGKGSYKTRNTFTNEAMARKYYGCINIGRGYKKRLVINGKVVARCLSCDILR